MKISVCFACRDSASSERRRFRRFVFLRRQVAEGEIWPDRPEAIRPEDRRRADHRYDADVFRLRECNKTGAGSATAGQPEIRPTSLPSRNGASRAETSASRAVFVEFADRDLLQRQRVAGGLRKARAVLACSAT